MSEATSDERMDLVTLDGFLTALVVGPALVPPSANLEKVPSTNQEQTFGSAVVTRLAPPVA